MLREEMDLGKYSSRARALDCQLRINFRHRLSHAPVRGLIPFLRVGRQSFECNLTAHSGSARLVFEVLSRHCFHEEIISRLLRKEWIITSDNHMRACK